MMRNCVFLLLMIVGLSAKAQQIVPGILIAKVGTEVSADDLVQVESVLAEQFISMKRKYPNAKKPDQELNAQGLPLIDLTRTYRIALDPEADLTFAKRILEELNLFEFVEFTTFSESLYTPNDPLYTNQAYLVQSSILAAWDSTQGDTNVVIGITDTSIDIMHEDLVDNVKYNYADPIDGQDNDNDSYIDNYAGWDFWGDDNNLFMMGEYHGTGVTAISSATADNSTGITGVGFNCKFLPVKVGNDVTSPTIVTADGHDAITYCADHGASIINCSWGTTSWSQDGQDVVDYATNNFDALVIAACGNLPVEQARYPATFDKVISVTGVFSNDVFDDGVTDHFTYHDSVDIAALGFTVYSTATLGGPGANPIYTTSGGTSLATPIVSGVAGLIRSKFPCLTALEVGQLMKDSADVIDNITQNMPYAGKIGKRLNALRPLTASPCTMVSAATELQFNFKVFPNPSQTAISIQHGSTARVKSVSVMDASGRAVSTTQWNPQLRWIDISQLPNGVYTMRLNTSDGVGNRRFVVSR